MWLYYVRRYRHVISGVIGVLCLAVLIYVGVKTTSLRNEDVNADTYSGKAMGTAVKKTIYAESTSESEQINDIIDSCLKELDEQISVRNSDSEVAKCNRNYVEGGVYTLSENILSYLKQEQQLYEETNGAFSFCIRPLTRLWGIEDGATDIPSETNIAYEMEYIDGSQITLTDQGIIFGKDGMAIDFGATGKGIACDVVAEKLAQTNVTGAVVSVGGSIAVYGSKGDGKSWHIGIRDPRGEEDDVVGVYECSNAIMISTSGDYEKYFEKDGKRYHHILDPATGYPVDNGLMSVTIISDSGFMSDALSTACFVLGLEDGMAYAKKKGVEAIFITQDKKVYTTDGLKKTFRITEDSYELSD
jgi:thiamine biosynthesis lipoprotein